MCHDIAMDARLPIDIQIRRANARRKLNSRRQDRSIIKLPTARKIIKPSGELDGSQLAKTRFAKRGSNLEEVLSHSESSVCVD